nr:hypothetical protein [Candidatus Gracilibacteria bacterium]
MSGIPEISFNYGNSEFNGLLPNLNIADFSTETSFEISRVGELVFLTLDSKYANSSVISDTQNKNEMLLNLYLILNYNSKIILILLHALPTSSNYILHLLVGQEGVNEKNLNGSYKGERKVYIKGERTYDISNIKSLISGESLFGENGEHSEAKINLN